MVGNICSYLQQIHNLQGQAPGGGKLKGLGSEATGLWDVFCTWAVALQLWLDQFSEAVISRKPLRGEVSQEAARKASLQAARTHGGWDSKILMPAGGEGWRKASPGTLGPSEVQSFRLYAAEAWLV